MIKRLTVAVAALFALAAQAFAAGTIPYSLSQQLDEFGKPLSGCRLYLIQAGTVSTPQNGYQDSGLTLVLPNPLICDAAGRLPQFFLADGSIKVRLTKSTGVNVVTADGILVVGASSGGGGGSPVDATTILATGDVKARYDVNVLSGFVRMNGRTIGSVSSGATERANADCQALFEYLWNTGAAALTISGGRGATANADWLANKTISLPDARSRALVGLDNMGATSAGIITTLTCATPTALGTGCGTETKTIAQVNIPSYTLPKTLAIANTLGLNDPGHVHGPGSGSGYVVNAAGPTAAGGAGSGFGSIPNTGTGLTGMSITGGIAITGDTQSGGSGTALGVLPPVLMLTFFMKL